MDGENSSLFNQLAGPARELWQAQAAAAKEAECVEEATYDQAEYSDPIDEDDSADSSDLESADAYEDDSYGGSAYASSFVDGDGLDSDASEAGEVPDLSAAVTDPLFVAMANHMLGAAHSINHDTGHIITRDAFEEMQSWVWENLWLPRVGFAEDYSNFSDGGYVAQPLPMPAPAPAQQMQ